ncbi:MAG: molybdopterin molybdotransferase MoeA [Sphingobacterium sp.]
MITVQKAEDIILAHSMDYGREVVSYETAVGRVLAENICADRDLPPCDRSTVDGIAIRYNAYEKGITTFSIKAIQPAGTAAIALTSDHQCIEIMTGSAIDGSLDTVIRYEDISIAGGMATIPQHIAIKKGQNIHLKGKDKLKGQILVQADRVITPAIIGTAASVGKTTLWVRKTPKVIIISTGDEMVSPELEPNSYQLRRSNSITIAAALNKYKIQADMLHINDDITALKRTLSSCLEKYDVMLITGGVSMGKFDFLPQACRDLGIERLFHKIKQRPGKPFWFGKSQNQQLVFAFPGNPVSAFMCLHRYFIPWLKKSLKISESLFQYAVLQQNISFPPALQYFAQVKLGVSQQGQWKAEPVNTNGSGDFSHLTDTDAFIELPLEKDIFRQGEVYKIWKYND